MAIVRVVTVSPSRWDQLATLLRFADHFANPS